MLQHLRFLLPILCTYSLGIARAWGNNCASTAPLQGNIFSQPKACPSTLPIEKDITELQESSHQKVKRLLENKEFPDIVLELKTKLPETIAQIPKAIPGELYIFVSMSLGEKALLNLAYEAKRFGSTLVMRGFYKGSYLLTAKKLHKIIQDTEQGVIIDPELFDLFSIGSVPTFILTKSFRLHDESISLTPMHDRLQGHVSAQYALERFAREGDLKHEAQALLEEQKLLQAGRK